MKAKSSSVLYIKKKKKNEKELLNFANNSNDLVITNLMFKDIIEKYKNFINFIKNLFNYISKNNNSKKEDINNINNLIKEKLKQKNDEIKLEISSLNKEINYIKKNHNKKLEEKNKYLEYYINQYDKLKEDNFILENTIFSKDNYITIFLNKLNYYESIIEQKNDYSEEEESEEKIEDIRERFLLYSKKINNEHQKELQHFQNDLSKMSKEHNREIIKTSRLEIEKNELNDYIKQIKEDKENNSMREYNTNNKSLFKKNNNKHNFIYDKININNNNIIINKENKLNEILLFKEFEIEKTSDDEDSVLLSEINYEIDLDNNNDNLNIDLDNNINFLKKSKMPKIDLTAIAQKQELRKKNENIHNINKNELKLDKININENFKSPSLVLNGLNNLNNFDNESSKNIKQLNLKQIEFNKVRVITDFVSSNENTKYINNIDFKINKIKKEIMKEKKKLENKKILINQFKNHYKLMRKYIKQLMKNLQIEDNTKYCRTEDNIQYCKEDYIY